MLPRPIVTLIAVALTLAELLNIVGQVFLGSGDTAFHVAYPAVLGALGLTAKRAPTDDATDTGTPGVTVPAEGSPPPPTPLDPTRVARHRHRGSP